MGAVIAVDANNGEILWQVPVGVAERLPEDKQNAGLPGGLAGPTATVGGLVFYAALADNRLRAFDARNFPVLRVVAVVMSRELRIALRVIRMHPWFSAAVAAALALGIGANTAVFTLVNAVLFAYFAAACLLSGLLFGLAPALQASRVDLNATLEEGSRTPVRSAVASSPARWLSCSSCWRWSCSPQPACSCAACWSRAPR